MNDVYDEGDLRAALIDMGANAPLVNDVLPRHPAPSRSRARWIAPLAVAAVVVAITVPLAVVRHSSQPLRETDGTEQLTGRSWKLVRVGSRSVSGPTLHIEPNGRFVQGTSYCNSLIGRMTITDDIDVDRVHQDLGLCPDVGPSETARQVAAIRALHREFKGRVSWSVKNGMLRLKKPGEPALVYAHAAGSPGRTRTFTYRGVGVVVPRSWVKNAQHCGSPTRDTVLYPIPTLSCLARQPPGVSAIRFAPLVLSRAHDPNSTSRTVLIDGERVTELSSSASTLQEVELDIRSRSVTVVITSPSRSEAARLADLVYLVHH